MASAPEDLDLGRVVDKRESVGGVPDVHHIHTWQLSEKDIALEAQVVPGRAEAREMMEVKATLRQRLEDEFGIPHVMLELELSSYPPPVTTIRRLFGILFSVAGLLVNIVGPASAAVI